MFPYARHVSIRKIEKHLKFCAYTCEPEIDYHIMRVFERVGDRVFCGIFIDVDEWLLKNIFKQADTNI